MRQYGLIGRTLGHSWSERYFTALFKAEGIDATYRNYEVELAGDTLPEVITRLDGYNVTIPYKQAIIPYLRALDPIAAEIGAVNVVRDGVGYNTDWIGFSRSIRSYVHEGMRALILGHGGAARAVRYGLGTMGIASEMVSVRGTVIVPVDGYTIIVNATPLGMYPYVEGYPAIDYTAIGREHVLFDCVYNPERTVFIAKGMAQGATVIGGAQMLRIQAQETWKIWNI